MVGYVEGYSGVMRGLRAILRARGYLEYSEISSRPWKFSIDALSETWAAL
jgi:hypothetical protein